MSSQAHLNKVVRSSTNGHVKPWELKPQQKDLMQVLRRPVETTADSVEKVASLKWLQICQITNGIFD